MVFTELLQAQTDNCIIVVPQCSTEGSNHCGEVNDILFLQLKTLIKISFL